MRQFRFAVFVATLLLIVSVVSAADNVSPFTPPGAIPLGEIGFDKLVHVPFPFNARFYLKLDSEVEGFVSVQFDADDQMDTNPSAYMLNADAEVLTAYSSVLRASTYTYLFGVYGKPPYYIVFNRPEALSVLVSEGDQVRQRREDIAPDERVEGRYASKAETIYHKLEGVQPNDIVTFYLNNDSGNMQVFNGHGQFMNRLLAYCHFQNHAIESFRLVGDPPYTVQISAPTPESSGRPYTLSMKLGNYFHEPVNLASVNMPINLQANDEGLCETITFKPPHSGVYLFSSEGELDPRFFTQLTIGANDNPISVLDYRRDGQHVVSRIRFDTTDFVHILISNSHSLTFSISDDTQTLRAEVIPIGVGDGPTSFIQSDSSKTRRYEINGEKGDLVFVKTLYDYSDPYCFAVLVDRNNMPLYPYEYRYDYSSPINPSFWSEYILGENRSYMLYSIKDTCRLYFQVFKAGTSVTYDDLERSFAPLLPWRPPSFNS
ncbi:MAG: hypothetical protein H0X30_07440 [Anaerolineae bacterium]|nr:hypothetical protein [Anaerolineae bacterium]